MESEKNTLNLKIRRFDLCENPEEIAKTLDITPNLDFHSLKKEIQKIYDINPETKVIKIRNTDGAHIPFSLLIENNERFYYIDVNNISYINTSSASLLQDAYVDAVRHKVKSIESRIAQAELLLPQLEWRRQAYMEDTVNALISKVAFLNRRFDELLPQYMTKIPESAA